MNGVVVPGAAGHVLVAVVVAAGEDVQAGPFLVADDHREGILEFLAKATSIMHVSRGLPHMLTSNQRGRGKEPVVVLGRSKSLVAVNMAKTSQEKRTLSYVVVTIARRPGTAKPLRGCA